jgi:hypothetical protein
MNDQIVSRDDICELAREAYARGVGRDEHGFNWHAPALADWLAEWDRCDVEAKQMVPA